MNLTPEQQNELLDAALAMSDYINGKEPLRDVSIDQHLETAEKFRPKPEKPKLLEGWVNEYPTPSLRIEYPTPSLRIWPSPDAAIRASSKEAIRTAVHLREVVPPDEGMRWEACNYTVRTQSGAFDCINQNAAKIAAETHNAALGFGKEGE